MTPNSLETFRQFSYHVFVLFENNGLVNGVLGMRPDYEDSTTVWFRFFATAEEHRGTLMPAYMIKALYDSASNLGYSNVQKIKARTGNRLSAAKLRRFGFKELPVPDTDELARSENYYFELGIDELAHIVEVKYKVVSVPDSIEIRRAA